MRKTIPLIVIGTLLLISCKKWVIDIVPVFDYYDISIAGDTTVTSVFF